VGDVVRAEKRRLREAGPWRRWGPYLSERQWGTVREGDEHEAWTSFTHDQARYRAYRWGEDGLAGFSDDRQRICLALALWNGADPILKERLFGLTNGEGNLREVAQDIGERVFDTFLFGVDGRSIHGGQTRYRDPHWRDLPLFYEYLHGDNGARIGASHQTGWTALVALLPREVAR
jgi:hypothetical protein